MSGSPPPLRSPRATLTDVAGVHAPTPKLPAQGGLPFGLSTVRPNQGRARASGDAADSCSVSSARSSTSACGMSRRLTTVKVAPSMTYTRPMSSATPSAAATLVRSTNIALATMSGMPSGGPTTAASQNGSASVLPPGQLERSVKSAPALALRPMLPM